MSFSKNKLLFDLYNIHFFDLEEVVWFPQARPYDSADYYYHKMSDQYYSYACLREKQWQQIKEINLENIEFTRPVTLMED